MVQIHTNSWLGNGQAERIKADLARASTVSTVIVNDLKD